jgi:hypothetical protein
MGAKGNAMTPIERDDHPMFTKHNKAQVWSCGGGTQSCAIAALIVQGKLPKPDFSVIADTSYETGATWEYMDKVLVPELAKVGVELVRVKCVEWASRWAKKQLFDNHRCKDVLIPAYSTQTWQKSKLKNFCTGGWKVEVIDNWFSKHHRITRSKICKWIGFSADEPRRYLKMMAGEEYKKGLIRFPIVHDFRMMRREAIKLVESMGWPTPPRSSCYMCPNHSDHEWRKLIKERPDEFAKAVAIEKEIQKTDPCAWLHRSCIPLDQVDFSQPEDLFTRPCDSGMCFV